MLSTRGQRSPSSVISLLLPALGAMGVVLCACAPAGEEGAPGESPPAWLEPGPPHERRLSGDETHRYRLALDAGDFLHLVVEQRGVDLVVSLLDPRGRELLAVDSPTGVHGAEALFAVAETAGTYRVEVRPWSTAAAGAYQVVVAARRPATAGDRRRAAAARRVHQAEALAGEPGADSLRAAADAFQEALDLWREAAQADQEALVLRRLGDQRYRLGEIAEALSCYRRARQLADALGGPDAALLNQLGKLQRLAGDAAATASYEEALGIARRLGDRHEEAAALNNLALAAKVAGEPWQALLRYDQALAIWQELGRERPTATTLYNVGSIYVLLDKLPEALDHLRRALALYQDRDPEGEAWALTAIGGIHLATGELESAAEVLGRAEELMRSTGSRRGEAITLDRLGTLRREKGRPEEAAATYDQALAAARELGDSIIEAQVLNNLGELRRRRGEAAAALALHERALDVFRHAGERSGEAYSHYQRARAERRQGRPRAALAAVEEALAIVESVRAASRSTGLRTSYLASVHDYYALRVDLLTELHRREPATGFDALAVDAAERGRVRSLLDMLAEAHGRRRLESVRLTEEAELLGRRVNERELQRRELRRRGAAPREVEAVAAELRALLLEQEKLRTRARTIAAESGDEPPADPLTLEEIQRQVLDEDTLLLIYDLGEERSRLALIGRDSLSTHELPPRPRIVAAAAHFRNALTTSHKRSGRRQAGLAAQALGQLLLAPVADRLDGRRLAVVADGALRSIPFAALTIPGTDAPLITAHEIVYLPSASSLAALRRRHERRRPAPLALAVVADPVFEANDPRLDGTAQAGGDDAFARLPATRREAETLLALTTPSESRAALGFAASRETVTGGDLSRYRVLHFATHSQAYDDHPELSGLVLSLYDEAGRPRDGFLRLHEIYGLHLPADLVVLSACRTAMGQALPGEGLIGLTRGFLYAGATRVVVSLWDVDDDGTAELMERFYRGVLRRHTPPAAALRAAQLGLLDEPRYQAPYYWAAFIVEGEWR